MEAVALRSRPRLRVGIFADRSQQPRWIVEALAAIAASDCAEVALLAHGRANARALPWLWRLYRHADESLFGAEPGPAEEVELAAHVPHVRALDMPCESADGREVAAWRDEVGRTELDVAFALGGIDEDFLCGVARYGVWRFCFGAEGVSRRELPGFHEVLDGSALTASGLRIRLDSGSPERLAMQSWSRTYAYSAARNRDLLVRKTACFAMRALRELHHSGRVWLQRCAPAREAANDSRLPETPRALRQLTGLAGRIAWRALQRVACVEQWALAYRFGMSAHGPAPGELAKFSRLTPPKDRLWADPFPVMVRGRYFIFFEELPFATGKAHISAIEVGRDGPHGEPVRVLERDYHLSYPFLIEHAGELYMVPETAENHTVELYRCVEFPHRWRLERTLLEGARFFDATFHRERDRWWMFVNAAPDGAHPDDELHIFFSASLAGPWREHPRNPVRSDARCARPAGRLYWHDGALHRPAQICVPSYGSGIAIQRVLRLSTRDYAEHEVGRIVPARGDGIRGLHTLNRAGDLGVLDLFSRRPRV